MLSEEYTPVVGVREGVLHCTTSRNKVLSRDACPCASWLLLLLLMSPLRESNTKCISDFIALFGVIGKSGGGTEVSYL